MPPFARFRARYHCARILVPAVVILAGSGCTAAGSPGLSATPIRDGSPAASSPQGPSGGAPSTVPTTAPTSPPRLTATPGSNPRTITNKPVAVGQPATQDRVQIRVVRMESITARAQMPGEVSGPAVAVAVELTNNSRTPLDASGVLVTLLDARKAPGSEMSAAPNRPMSGQLAPGGKASGVYVFAVPTDARGAVTIYVTLPSASPVVAFTGAAPR